MQIQARAALLATRRFSRKLSYRERDIKPLEINQGLVPPSGIARHQLGLGSQKFDTVASLGKKRYPFPVVVCPC